MSEKPSPRSSITLSRMGLVGLAGVVLFLVLWAILGNWGVDPFTRLTLSVCTPPAIMSAVIGIYMLATLPNSSEH